MTDVDPSPYQIFENNDRGYLAWLAANPAGFVINIQRTYNPSDARIHRADCYTINGTPAKGSTWTGPYVKVCSPKINVLDRWAQEKGFGAIRRCGACNP